MPVPAVSEVVGQLLMQVVLEAAAVGFVVLVVAVAVEVFPWESWLVELLKTEVGRGLRRFLIR